MNFNKKICSVLILVGLIGLTPPCYAEQPNKRTSFEEVKQNSKDLLKTINAYTVEQRDEAVNKTKAALDKLDQRIEALEKRADQNWDKMDKTARQNTRASLQELRRQRTKVAEWYGSLKSSTGEAWVHMKNGFTEAYQALDEAWQKSEKEFGAAK
ncbi:MAG: hypothetical protein KKB30_07455 [Proteobacteria bacterium]|nr:hypothetical protein [Pseudomonadota bacterium]MBU1717104.1 hypothetical protein [Pseudomonadota bacterium]